MKNTLRAILFSLSLALLLSACGGGGGGDNGGGTAPPTIIPTKALLKVSTANVPSGTLLGGVQISIVLPAGVTPSVLSGNDATGSVAASGNAVGSMAPFAGYNASTNTLTTAVINLAGFASGEVMTITCSIAAGTTVTAANFPSQATETGVFDSSNITNSIPGATCPISVTLQ